ncbi:MAG: proline dehydrogenase [Bacteroidetes bacterium CG23_combo_of_CG06-09_8_20_14_all_32_9]|nr:MAG: proline dehydrogenase [Bacteroidetes bacterium CG23_combo_of_CG06-09_8_20_14_all_32_9]
MFNKTIASLLPYMPQKFVWAFSKRYIAGKTLDEAINSCKELNKQGIKITIDVLGEFITKLDEAEQNRNEYLQVIELTEKSKINGNYSLKPSMFGLLIDKDMCYKYIREIVAKAKEYNNFVRIDMEDTKCTDLELELLRKLKKEFPNNTGIVVQAYLKRTLPDVTNLLDLNTPASPMNYRLCKGIYNEPKELVFKKYEEINQNYLLNLEFMLKNKIYTCIATHDKVLVNSAYKLLEKYNVPKNKYEFQMLLGVTPELRKSIIDKGHSMRVYVPFGTKWFAYCTRRLKENPKMTGMIIKALFKRG